MRIYKRLIAITLVIVFGGLLLVPLATTYATSRDCDSNALIYCGVLTKTELKDALAKGTGKKYQSAKELQNLFGYYHIESSDISSLVTGYVTNDNRVVVDGKTLPNGKNVYTMGRSYMPGSTRLTQFSYPIYKRHPSVSFRSSSIAAFIKMNPDGTYAYAVLKSCGNIVPGKKYTAPPPTPTPTPTPTPEPKYNIYARKWLDADGNGNWDTNEAAKAGVIFTLTGTGVSKQATSDDTGYAWFYNLPAGNYTVTETVPSGYMATTPTTQTFTAQGENGAAFGGTFGNKPVAIPETITRITVVKFNDINGNKTQDTDEPIISGWKFKVSGPNDTEFELTTGKDGTATKSDLAPGIYTVTEVLEDGWTPTTDLSQHREVVGGATEIFVFGNQLYKAPVKKKKEPAVKNILPVTGPLAVATMAGSSAAFSGAAVAWARSRKRLKHSYRK